MRVETDQVHGTCVAPQDGEGGVLLMGASGTGKSDLALRLIDAGWRLVADDQVLLAAKDGEVYARPPQRITGLLEVRGVGLVVLDALPSARLALCVHLGKGQIPRLPEPRFDTICGSPLARLNLNAFEASAIAKIRLASALIQAPPRPGGTFPFSPPSGGAI